MCVDDFLKLVFVLVAAKPFNFFAAFEKDNGWNSRNLILHREFHVLGDINFSYFGVFRVVGRQFVDDWTQSLARSSALRIEINKHRSVRTEDIGFECIASKLNRHFFLLLMFAPVGVVSDIREWPKRRGFECLQIRPIL